MGSLMVNESIKVICSPCVELGMAKSPSIAMVVSAMLRHDLVSALALTPGRIFAFTSDLAKIRPGIDCMLENMSPSLINTAPEVSLAFQLIKLL